MPQQQTADNCNVLLILLVILGIWVIYSFYKNKASFPQYQGASMAGVMSEPGLMHGTDDGAISGHGGNSLMQLNMMLHGAAMPM